MTASRRCSAGPKRRGIRSPICLTRPRRWPGSTAPPARRKSFSLTSGACCATTARPTTTMRIPARSASPTCAARSRPCSEGRRRRRQRPNRWAAPSSGSDLICHCEPEGRSDATGVVARPKGPWQPPSVDGDCFASLATLRGSPRPFGPRDDCSVLHVVIQVELCRMRPHPHEVHFLAPLQVDPSLEQVRREDPAFQQKLVILLQRRERFV